MTAAPWLTPGLIGRLRSVRLCALDVDGTLLNSHHRVSARTREAIDAVRAAGIEVVLASSRSPMALKPVLDELDAPAGTPFVASQGAILGSFDEAGELVVAAHRAAPLPVALDVVNHATALGLSVSWYSGSAWLVAALDDAIEREAAITRSTPSVVDLTRLTVGPDKLMLISAPDEVDALLQATAALGPDLHGQSSSPTYLEITAAGVDKASTITTYLRSKGHGDHQVLAMGDGPNDLGMLSSAGVSIAPANAHPAVLEAADAVSASNDDDGVAQALGQLVRAVS